MAHREYSRELQNQSLTGAILFLSLSRLLVALNPCHLRLRFPYQKYIALDPTKPMQLSVKQDGTVDLFEMQVR